MKYAILTLLFAIAVWFSFYTEPLSDKLQREALSQYKPDELVDYHWQHDLDALRQQALAPADFLSRLQADPEALRQQAGHVLGIGSNVYYVLTGEADDLTYADYEFRFSAGGIDFVVPTKYIFGNVAREASGWFDIGDFQNTMDFNAVSACINERIRTQVIADKPQHAADCHHCTFCGAVEVSAQLAPGQAPHTLTLYPYVFDMAPVSSPRGEAE